MDNSPTLQKRGVGGKIYETNSNSNNKPNNNNSIQPQRNKLVRSTESIGNAYSIAVERQPQADIQEEPTTTADAKSTTATTTAIKAKKCSATAAVDSVKEQSVMGGGFAIPPQKTTTTSTITATTKTISSIDCGSSKNPKQQPQQQQQPEQRTLRPQLVKQRTPQQEQQQQFEQELEEQQQQQQQQQSKHQQLQRQHAQQTTQQFQQQQMHEKLLDPKAECGKEKTDKLKKLHKNKDIEKSTTTTATATAKPSKESRSKFAEKLRRSFRRGEHKSLEIKRPERSFDIPTHSPQESGGINSANFGLKSLPALHKNSQSIFSLSNLPGLGGSTACGSGGHINPALLLDSPDEGTPPEYAYHHLSSVATTNSSTSLESNFGDFGERTSSQSSISYWAWQQSNSSMGGEVSTTSSSGGTGAGTGGSGSGGRAESNESRERKDSSGKASKSHKQKLESQSSSKSDTLQQPQPQQQQQTQATSLTHTAASRSCSITSESSSTKLTRLQNFLFKSSNESTKSFQGHSNEGFTASSHNSSSGEWENLGAYATTATTATTTSGSIGSQAPADFYVGSFPEENESFGDGTAAPADASEAGNYYQYTLTSPNNPFLPEIIARTYHSTYDEEDELDANVTAVKYSGAQSTQLPTPAYSRAGSQESTHSESAVLHASAHSHSASPASSSSSTPGRQKRKLFSLNSPTRHLLHQQHTHHHHAPATATTTTTAQQQQQQKPQATATNVDSSAATMVTAKSTSVAAGAGFVRSLNPFLPMTASASAAKRAPHKQSAVTSPIAVPQDLNAKREEFLRATMKICLVVSPPNSKLQLKSKSLTHLDGLDSVIACQHANTGKPPNSSGSSAANASAAAEQQQQTKQQQQQVQQQQAYMLNPAAIGVVSNSSVGVNTPTGAATNIYASTASSHKKKSSFMQRKKPLLTRSEVSSSEYFSVSFCTEQGVQDEEFIAATKGVTLSAALTQALKKRNLSFSQIAITDNNPPSNFLEAGYSPLASSLDENTDVENLAGHHLIITDRDGSRKTLQKAASFGSRTRPPRLLSSASTEETSDQAVPGKQLKQRWSGIFGSKNAQQSQLCELLNGYAKNGVPQKSSVLNFDHPQLEAALEYLDKMHKSWKDFVNSESMNDNEMRIQTAIWELVTTEVYYIHALQTVTDLFLACLEAVQAERLLTDVDQHRLFSNVRDICEANLRFWTLYLYPMVAHSVATREPLRIGFFQQGFVAFATIFAPYKKYCAEQSTCQFYCKELNRTNALFTSYLAWCESQKMCNRLRLADILVRPMQRLTKYSLLLAAIKKHMSDVEQIEAVDTMIHTVENFVFSVNNHLTTRQENERLKGVMARIESYDVVDTNNEQLDKMIKQYSQMFDLCAPMKGCPTHHVRHLFMEGDHKYKDNVGKADVHCFLLTDMLLVCKAIAKRGLGSLKVIRQPYLTDRLIVQHSNNILNCVYLNEFQVAITAFTLQCSEAKNWYESLKRARQIYMRLKQGSTNWDSFRFGGSGASAGTADSLGVKKSPMNSSICSHVSSANNSHSGSVEWNDSRNISVDFEKTNSLSSDEGSMGKNLAAAAQLKLKINPTSANTLSVQPLNHLGQSLPNLNLNHSHTNLYHSYSNNTLLVPGTTASHSGILLLSPSHRGISYPPPSPTRVPLRRGLAFTTSTKNPPLVKTRNITSQNSINLQQTPAMPIPTPTPTATPTPTPTPLPADNSASKCISSTNAPSGSHSPTAASTTQPIFLSGESAVAPTTPEPSTTMLLSKQNSTIGSCQTQTTPKCNETDV